MAVLAWVSIAFALLEAGFCAYLWFELQRRVLSTSVSLLLKQSSEELSKDYGRQFRAIETEWDDMYQKFARLAGRMDRTNALHTPVLAKVAHDHTEESDLQSDGNSGQTRGYRTRSEILRNYRRSKSNEQNSAD